MSSLSIWTAAIDASPTFRSFTKVTMESSIWLENDGDGAKLVIQPAGVLHPTLGCVCLNNKDIFTFADDGCFAHALQRAETRLLGGDQVGAVTLGALRELERWFGFKAPIVSLTLKEALQTVSFGAHDFSYCRRLGEMELRICEVRLTMLRLFNEFNYVFREQFLKLYVQGDSPFAFCAKLLRDQPDLAVTAYRAVLEDEPVKAALMDVQMCRRLIDAFPTRRLDVCSAFDIPCSKALVCGTRRGVQAYRAEQKTLLDSLVRYHDAGEISPAGYEAIRDVMLQPETWTPDENTRVSPRHSILRAIKASREMVSIALASSDMQRVRKLVGQDISWHNRCVWFGGYETPHSWQAATTITSVVEDLRFHLTKAVDSAIGHTALSKLVASLLC